MYIHVEVPVPFPVHVEVPVPVPMPIPMPVHVHVPVYITRQTLQQQSPPSTLQPVSTFTKFTKEAKDYIDSVEHLDFQATPRMNTVYPWMDDIHIKEGVKTYDDQFYRVLLLTAYDLGYKQLDPSVAPSVLQNNRGKNRITYVDKLMKAFPEFLHECYRHVTKKHGLAETTKELCRAMNDYAKDKYSECPTRGSLNMTKHHFWKFFYMNGGKLKKPVTKPRLTKEHVQKRLVFANKWISKLGHNDKPYVAYLDEKWFYTSSRRKKLKLLPRASFESEEDAFVAKPKLRSKRFPCKVMFMGVICPPVDGKTNGRILLKRVSERVQIKDNRTINILLLNMISIID